MIHRNTDDTKQESGSREDTFLECEKVWVFWALMFVGGYYGGYTYNIRGGVFCNAQTANLVLLSMNLGNGNFGRAAYYLIPFTVYFMGTVLSEILAKTIKKFRVFRWDTILVGLELCVAVLLGLMPGSWPDQICQVSLNFICAMQFNTFRQAEGVGMATTFCTNHVRQFGSNLVKYIRSGNPEALGRFRMHGMMLLIFMAGVIAATIGCRLVGYYSLLGAAIVLFFVFIRLMIADRTYERELLDRVPRGH